MRPRPCIVAIAVASSLIAAACSSSSQETLDVYAASSLTDAFGMLEESFEADNPGVDVRLNLAGSNALLRQIDEGADAGVYAPADVTFMDDLRDRVFGDIEVYASNRLTLVVPADDDAVREVRSPADLARSDVLVARCAPGVPCGDATDRYLFGAGLTIGRATDEPNVRAVLLKVVRGEADAGFVYTTDAMVSSADLTEIPLDNAPTVDLAVAVLSEDPIAAAFARHVHSPDGAEVFRTLGFAVP